jgi:ferredoxin
VYQLRGLPPVRGAYTDRSVPEAFLRQFTAADWTAAREAILPSAHGVDRTAVRIWSHFFPLPLSDAFECADDAAALTRRLRIDGNPRLVPDQIEASHWFFHAHRHWPAVKASIASFAERDDDRSVRDLVPVVRAVAAEAAAASGVSEGLLVGISYVGLMTLRQVGLEAFRAPSARADPATSVPARSPDAMLAARQRDDSQGVFGFLRSTRRFSVVFDERRADARFPILENQHLTTAAAADTRDYTRGPRRFQEGPIPAQCRSATCGTCWIGVLGGAGKLSAIEADEARKLREFGYLDVQEARPIIRLACKARAFGNVTIVIPPWNGFVSRLYASGADRGRTGAQS